jgi:hypothetical protein
MTTTIDLTEVTELLSEYVGTRYDAGRVAGRNTMAAILSAQFDLSSQEVAELLDALEQSCAIRWIPQPGADWMNNRLGLEIELGYWKLERSIG